MKQLLTPIALSSLLLLSACRGTEESTPSSSTAAHAAEASMSSADALAAAQALGVKNPSAPEAGLLCAGQLSVEQFDALVDGGFKSFINLRTEGESGTGWEGERADSMSVEYVQLPIAGADGINEEMARLLDEVLRTSAKPTVLYCGSSNRVGALYGLRAYFVQGADAEQSLERAKAAGVTRLEPRVRAVLGL